MWSWQILNSPYWIFWGRVPILARMWSLPSGRPTQSVLLSNTRYLPMRSNTVYLNLFSQHTGYNEWNALYKWRNIVLNTLFILLEIYCTAISIVYVQFYWKSGNSICLMLIIEWVLMFQVTGGYTGSKSWRCFKESSFTALG